MVQSGHLGSSEGAKLAQWLDLAVRVAALAFVVICILHSARNNNPWQLWLCLGIFFYGLTMTSLAWDKSKPEPDGPF